MYIDKILVTGKNEQEHFASLEEVLQRLEEAGLRLQKAKCRFMAPSVTYLGHQIDAEGLHPVEEKVKAVQEAPEPRNVPELKAYLGLLSYYSKFLIHFDPNLEIVLACDASAYGIRAVLSHKLPDGTEKPVGFVSRTLTDTEKKYSQIERRD